MTGGDKQSNGWLLATRLLALVLAFVTAAALLYFFRNEFHLEKLARREEAWQAHFRAQPAAALGIAFVAYVVVTGLSLPGAAAMSVVYGKLFGFWPALVLVSFASTTGATFAFLLSRYLLGSMLQERFSARLAGFNQAWERDGAYYLLSLRLIPQVPFFVVNLVMGLTPIRTRTFWWVSQLGMLPGTCVFVFAGASAPSLAEISERGLGSLLSPRFVVALTLLALVPLLLRWIQAQRSKTKAQV